LVKQGILILSSASRHAASMSIFKSLPNKH
jgi:hypothetical protein